MNADDLPPEKLMMAGRRWSASGGPLISSSFAFSG